MNDDLRDEVQALRIAQNYRLGSIDLKLDALLELERKRRPEWHWWLMVVLLAVIGILGWFHPT